MAQLGRPSGAATLVLVACLLASCGNPETRDGEAESGDTAVMRSTPSAPTASASPSASADPTNPVEPLPSLPTTDNARVLAGQLDRAAATLRGRDASTSERRRAAEFQQLAVRALVTARAAFVQRVTERLEPHTSRDVRSDLRAGKLLYSMTAPQRHLPRWRIVAPRPAAELRGYYREAQRRTGVPWNYLAAVNLVETRMGRIRGTSTAGAQGPMQFMPSTWAVYGAGGDINDPRDAILAAARLLKRNGAPADMAGALWHYNPSHNYVGAVQEYARTMRRSASAYGGYWHWRVLYRHVRATYVLPVGYPEKRAVALPSGW